MNRHIVFLVGFSIKRPFRGQKGEPLKYFSALAMQVPRPFQITLLKEAFNAGIHDYVSASDMSDSISNS